MQVAELSTHSNGQRLTEQYVQGLQQQILKLTQDLDAAGNAHTELALLRGELKMRTLTHSEDMARALFLRRELEDHVAHLKDKVVRLEVNLSETRSMQIVAEEEIKKYKGQATRSTITVPTYNDETRTLAHPSANQEEDILSKNVMFNYNNYVKDLLEQLRKLRQEKASFFHEKSMAETIKKKFLHHVVVCWTYMLQGTYFDSWNSYTATRRKLWIKARNTINKVVIRLMKAGLMLAFERWRHQTIEEKQMRSKALKAVRKLLNAALVSAFERLRDHIIE